jgi:hypothetical protein
MHSPVLPLGFSYTLWLIAASKHMTNRERPMAVGSVNSVGHFGSRKPVREELS